MTKGSMRGEATTVRSARRLLTASAMASSLSACGTQAPAIPEAWEAQDVSAKMVYMIKKNIFCETIEAIRRTNSAHKFYLPNSTKLTPLIPADYSVQIQTTITIEESSSSNPSAGYSLTFPNGSQSGISIGQNLSLGLSGTLSSSATRTDTTYSYYNVGKITAPGANDEFCLHEVTDRRGSSLLLTSDLGIRRFLEDNVPVMDVLHSSDVKGSKKPDRVDVYSYDLKFAVVTSGGFNPTWKLVSVSGSGTPILGLSRQRTHELLLTFGPTGPDGFAPSAIAQAQQTTTQINQSIRSSQRFAP